MTTMTYASDYGVDVSKGSLQIDSAQESLQIPNDVTSIRRWLKRLPPGCCFAVEATGSFHVCFARLAHARRHTVYLIDGFRLARYREGVGTRAKTDRLDAQLLRRYLEREKADLRAWEPPPERYTEVLGLLHRRERVVAARVALEQSLQDLAGDIRGFKAVVRRLRVLTEGLTKRISESVQANGWGEAQRRCQQIEGIGPLTSAALATVFQRGRFRHSDAFIAFLGLDVRVRDSGKQRGKRKLTKRGDPELRRLLYNAAMSASSTPTWAPYYQRHLQRGLSTTAALIVLARKLARVAFALMRDTADYDPGKAVTC
jgi:transposase